MNTLFHRRRENLLQLVKSRGGQKRFLDEVGYTKGWLSRLIRKATERDLSEKVAREIEDKAGIPSGSLDSETAEVPEPEEDSDNKIGEILSQNLRRLMEARGVNQAELARRAKMAVTSVNRVFNALDKDVSPRLETLAGIARGLGVHTLELLMAVPPAPAPVPHELPSTVARQLSRLIEDFLLSGPEERTEMLRLAAESSSNPSAKKGGRGEA